MAEGIEQVEPDEVLYRRLVVEQYNSVTGIMNPAAFRPTDDDAEGLSLFRAKYLDHDPRRIITRPARQFWVAEVVAADLIEKLQLEVRPTLEDLSHVLLPSIRTETRRDSVTKALQVSIAKDYIRRVHGPFVMDSAGMVVVVEFP